MNVVIDANLFLALVLPLPYSEKSLELFQALGQAGSVIHAPSLWSYEVVSALRKAFVHRLLEQDELDQSLRYLRDLSVHDVPQTLWLQRQSLVWADRLGSTKAYDSAYLAAAESLQAEFWTADRSLANAAKETGAVWVHCIDDFSPEM